MGNYWLALGFVAQGLFTGRFLVQWIASERAKRSVVPFAFWIFSVVGGGLLLVYSIWRKDPVFIFGYTASLLIYLRIFSSSSKRKSRRAWLIVVWRNSETADGPFLIARNASHTGPRRLVTKRHSSLRFCFRQSSGPNSNVSASFRGSQIIGSAVISLNCDVDISADGRVPRGCGRCAAGTAVEVYTRR